MELEALKESLERLLEESQSRSADRGDRLAQRLIRSVLPLFVVDSDDRPHRRGSCVLIQIDGFSFGLTARHVLNDGDSRLYAAPASRGRLVPLPYRHAFSSSAPDLDVAVLPFRRSQLDAFVGGVFLAPNEIGENHEVEQTLNGNSYFILGYSASASQVRVFHGDRSINQVSFQFTRLGGAA